MLKLSYLSKNPPVSAFDLSMIPMIVAGWVKPTMLTRGFGMSIICLDLVRDRTRVPVKRLRKFASVPESLPIFERNWLSSSRKNRQAQGNFSFFLASRRSSRP